jgi:serine/threonine-protein kinase RsbT
MVGAAKEIRIEVEVNDDVTTLIARLTSFLRERGIGAAPSTRVLTVASELGTNLVKYARGGAVTFCLDPNAQGMLLVSSDRGPGIADTAAALRDHHSTSGTLGLGLNCVKRMSDRFQIRSRIEEGTAITSFIAP